MKIHVLPTQCIYVFCVDLRTNSDYFPIQIFLFAFIGHNPCFTNSVYHGVFTEVVQIDTICHFALSISQSLGRDFWSVPEI
jgi:hypothetical protein